MRIERSVEVRGKQRAIGHVQGFSASAALRAGNDVACPEQAGQFTPLFSRRFALLNRLPRREPEHQADRMGWRGFIGDNCSSRR